METIIVQDTDAAILDVLTEALKMEGFDVLPVADIEGDFLSLIDQHRPHVVMLDYRLNGEACKQTCFQIKQRYPHPPVIAMSCNYNIDRLYGANGFDGYIRKPFDLDLLYTILRRHIPEQQRKDQKEMEQEITKSAIDSEKHNEDPL